jgi:hypothetical protein
MYNTMDGIVNKTSPVFSFIVIMTSKYKKNSYNL